MNISEIMLNIKVQVNLNNTKNTERKEIQADLIKSAVNDLKYRTKQLSENKKRIEKPDKIVDIVEKILGFNEKYQERQGLKILTPDHPNKNMTVVNWIFYYIWKNIESAY